MEVGRNVLVERMDEWLPKLSDGLQYSQPTYPVLIHGVPTSFDASRNSEDVNEQLIGDNIDTITHPAALRSTKFLGGTHSQLHQKTHGSLVVHFSDPTIANACINLHITLNGETTACSQVRASATTLLQLSPHGPLHALLQEQEEVWTVCRGPRH